MENSLFSSPPADCKFKLINSDKASAKSVIFNKGIKPQHIFPLLLKIDEVKLFSVGECLTNFKMSTGFYKSAMPSLI